MLLQREKNLKVDTVWSSWAMLGSTANHGHKGLIFSRVPSLIPSLNERRFGGLSSGVPETSNPSPTCAGI